MEDYPVDSEKDTPSGEINPQAIGRKVAFFQQSQVKKLLPVESPTFRLKFHDGEEYSRFFQFVYEKRTPTTLRFENSETVYKLPPTYTNKVKIYGYHEPMRNQDLFGKEADFFCEIEAKSIDINKTIEGHYYLQYSFSLSDPSALKELNNKFFILEFAHPTLSIFLAPVDITARFKLNYLNELFVFTYLRPAPHYDCELWVRTQQSNENRDQDTDSSTSDDELLIASRRQADAMFSDEEHPYYSLAKKTIQVETASDTEVDIIPQLR